MDAQTTLRSRPRRRRRRRSRGDGPPKILALLEACVMFPPIVDGVCACGCGRALTGRRTRWASKRCAARWRENHVWTSARRAAKRRDKRTCVKCGTRKPTKPARARFASAADFDVALAAYNAVRLEVNHRTPLAGATRAAPSCHHHLDNLETLCGPCHAGVTRAQAGARAAARRTAKAAAIAEAA